MSLEPYNIFPHPAPGYRFPSPKFGQVDKAICVKMNIQNFNMTLRDLIKVI